MSNPLQEIQIVKPADIESKSFEIIASELGDYALDPVCAPIIKRCIHTSADFDYAQNLVFSEGVVPHAVKALQNGVSIITDTNMAKAGINKRVLARFGGEVLNFMANADVATEAKERGITRAAVCMERGAALGKPLIYAVGNAPTALIRLYEMLEEGTMVTPALIVGVPVGFVNVVESKELIISRTDVPYIVARGRKGGSNIAACICNALLYLASNNERA